ncbi:hypothetical protein K458DRAFT_6347 [Lentithecium fluviatile CBS 122367]|uniref:Uncharacterized protein n=1 Tax=Lentithecium fluviatile CBS 122367 TaxID=1168545 RepID=A0A6G1JMS4_9PLEO|nr:hypothetical protein K458DRAFT_6347 [Lentithecium fluviatile CBS 122367]
MGLILCFKVTPLIMQHDECFSLDFQRAIYDRHDIGWIQLMLPSAFLLSMVGIVVLPHLSPSGAFGPTSRHSSALTDHRATVARLPTSMNEVIIPLHH